MGQEGGTRERGLTLVAFAIILFGSTTLIGYDGLISWIVLASAFFVLVTGVIEVYRSDEE